MSSEKAEALPVTLPGCDDERIRNVRAFHEMKRRHATESMDHEDEVVRNVAALDCEHHTDTVAICDEVLSHRSAPHDWHALCRENKRLMDELATLSAECARMREALLYQRLMVILMRKDGSMKQLDMEHLRDRIDAALPQQSASSPRDEGANTADAGATSHYQL
jgi:hypothetical protein